MRRLRQPWARVPEVDRDARCRPLGGLILLLGAALVAAGCAGKLNESEKRALSAMAEDACVDSAGDADIARVAVENHPNFPDASDAKTTAWNRVIAACWNVEADLAKAATVSPDCLAAMEQAMAVDEMHDTVADYDLALTVCGSYEEWITAAEVTGADQDIVAELWPWNRCNSPEALPSARDGELCREVIENEIVGG